MLIKTDLEIPENLWRMSYECSKLVKRRYRSTILLEVHDKKAPYNMFFKKERKKLLIMCFSSFISLMKYHI